MVELWGWERKEEGTATEGVILGAAGLGVCSGKGSRAPFIGRAERGAAATL